MFYDALREWAVIALLISFISLIGGILLARHLFVSSRSLWLALLILIPLGLCIWSAITARNTFLLYQYFYSHLPHHGVILIVMRVEQTSAYTQAIFISQIQIAIALLIILLLVIIWILARRAAGEPEPIRREARRSLRGRLL